MLEFLAELAIRGFKVLGTTKQATRNKATCNRGNSNKWFVLNKNQPAKSPIFMAKGQLALFRQRLPKRPYHTDDWGGGLSIAGAQRALKSRYIQHNGPTHKCWLVFDVDRPDALYDWRDRDVPPPNIVPINPDNGHGHLIYGLEVPIRTAPDGRPDPLRYAAAVELALRDKLDADIGYSGLICKNPLHEHWQTHVWDDELYDLAQLSDWLDLGAYKDRRKKLPEYGLGRNCTLFERLRHWSYKAIRQGWPEYDRWMMAVEDRALGYNDFKSPLPQNEVMHTAKSVGNYTYKHFSPAGFRAWQAKQGSKGGKISKGGGRKINRYSERQSTPWFELGISRSTYYRKKNENKL